MVYKYVPDKPITQEELAEIMREYGLQRLPEENQYQTDLAGFDYDTPLRVTRSNYRQQQPQEKEPDYLGTAIDVAKPVAASAGGVGGAISALGTAGAGGGLEALEIGLGLAEGPLTAGQASLTSGLGAAGTAAALYNGFDAASNIISDSRRGKGTVEGLGTLGGTTAGYFLGGPIGAGIGSIAGRTLGRGLASIGDSLGFIGQKSTKEYEQERWSEAAEKGAKPVDQESAVTFYQTSHPPDDDQIFDEGALAGRKYNWDEVKEVASGKDVWGSLGFFQTFPDWISGYTPQEREAIANAALDNDLLSSNKGDILFLDGDDEKIREIAAQVKAGTYEPLKTAEQRWADKQAYLQMLKDTEGYVSEDLGKPFTPEEAVQPDVSQGQTQVAPQSNQPSQGPGRRPVRRPPVPGVPEPMPEPPPPPPPPPIKTAQDYADAYMSVYEKAAGGQLFNPLNRSF